jgi:hypothetical protein
MLRFAVGPLLSSLDFSIIRVAEMVVVAALGLIRDPRSPPRGDDVRGNTKSEAK